MFGSQKGLMRQSRKPIPQAGGTTVFLLLTIIYGWDIGLIATRIYPKLTEDRTSVITATTSAALTMTSLTSNAPVRMTDEAYNSLCFDWLMDGLFVGM